MEGLTRRQEVKAMQELLNKHSIAFSKGKDSQGTYLTYTINGVRSSLRTLQGIKVDLKYCKHIT